VLGDLATPADEEDNDLEEALTAFFAGSPEGAAFRLFRNRNILMVRDSRENLRLVEAMVEELDQPPYQVAIEAKFITVSQDDLRDLGVEWTKYSGGKAADNNPARNPDPLGTHGKGAVQVSNFLSELAASATAAEIGQGSMTLSGVIGDRTFDVLISAIEKKNSSVTLSAPRVTVMNNRTARIRKGNTYYYFEEYDTATVDKGDARGDVEVLVPTGTPVELPVGITFDVKVNIGNDGKTVLLGLKPSIVSFLGWEDYISAGSEDEDEDEDEEGSTTVGQIRLPRIHEQVAMTTVGVSSGETVVMGGMIDNSSSRNIKKVPFLGDLPLIGFLFRRTETMNIPTNLLIFVTAKVISPSGEYLNVRVQDVLP
jgi:type IV pilus assembly protein PilQ